MKIVREIHCTTRPNTNAIATDRNIEIIIVNAFSVFRSSMMLVSIVPELILNIDIMNAAPNSSNTIETVVEVGRPRVLKRSSKNTSLITTAKKMHITSLK